MDNAKWLCADDIQIVAHLLALANSLSPYDKTAWRGVYYITRGVDELQRKSRKLFSCTAHATKEIRHFLSSLGIQLESL